MCCLGDDDEKDLVQESQANLRINEISDALRYSLNLFTSKVGLGSDFYKFKDGAVYVNKENVMSANSDVFRKIKKQENIITDAITNLIYGIASLIKVDEKFDVSVFYDDSIIEDTEKVQLQAQKEYSLQLISKAQYYRDVYKLSENEAIEFAKKMNKEIAEEAAQDITEENAYGM